MYELRGVRAAALGVALLISAPQLSLAQDPPPKKTQQRAEKKQQGAEKIEAEPKGETTQEKAQGDAPLKSSLYYEVMVTATRTEKDTFDIPNPVSVVSEEKIAEKNPNTVTDLLRELPGVDVNGVGTNQPRPIIRGMRGQRILLLEDGIRLNNSRQTSDFGEIPGIVDAGSLSRLEVVRGPASVLYGSDAIGGVINMITRRPGGEGGSSLGGFASYRYSSADSQGSVDLSVSGHDGPFSYIIGGSYRESEDYEAPSGSFGEIRLDDDTKVNGTGMRDDSLRARFEYVLGAEKYIFAKFERYRSHDAGFGWVDPQLLDPGDTNLLVISYPFQDVDQFTAGYRAANLACPVANSFSATVYTRNNERRFNLDLGLDLGHGLRMNIASSTFTDVETIGTRVDATKLIGDRQVLSYGIDAFQDDAVSTKLSTTSFNVPFIPSSSDDSPPLPDATYTSFGAFLQDDVAFTERFSAIVGLRAQSVTARTSLTVGLPDLEVVDSTDDALVWATNLIYKLTDEFKLVGTVGTSFRSPNLAERFFHGETPEGSGFQVRNPELDPERGFNVDLGLKYRRKNVFFEMTAFRNRIDDGIAIADITAEPTPEDPEPQATFQNINIDSLTYKGYEMLFDWAFARGWSFGVNYTHLVSQNDASPDQGVSDSFSDKLNASVRYHEPGGRYWAEYYLRHNGNQSDTVIGAGNPLGEIFPAFTVHSLRGGVRLFRGSRSTHLLGLGIENLTNELYAEFSNAQFFRPQAKRSFLVTWTVKVD